LALLLAGTTVTLTPLVVGTLFGPAALAAIQANGLTACEVAQSQTPVLGVAVPYAIANVFLTVLGPIIVGLTFVQ
jgi:hypothetical protein